MKKEYIKPMALAKEMQGEQMLEGSNPILWIDEDGNGGGGYTQPNEEATKPGMGKGIWFYLDD
ncbi:MAG: hypothetical protein IJ604_11535 [Prevotella sp.]|nr:hypothetical protein [Prevotella sp.]MBR1463988.1 hypothetical protein [Prevotella sp.]